ncbi:hypothetical protein KPL70_006839 [Citrus sinensis]|nr:hypothetical protein KPL70_006839 [Citrus sinensis]
MNMRPNWELKQCCNHEQFVFLVTVSVCAAVILALWRTILLKPFKLVTVFLHEASHAIACKLTCGKVLIYISMQVEGSQVHADEVDTLRTLYSEVYHNASCVSDEESQLNNCRCDEQLVFSSCFILELNESTREMTIGLNGTWHGRSTGRIRTAQHDTSTFR